MVKTTEPAVLFEDEDLLVVDKPGGLACHSSERPTLVGWLRQHGVAAPRLIHRLDRETSGLVVVARNERAAKLLGNQVLRRETEYEVLRRLCKPETCNNCYTKVAGGFTVVRLRPRTGRAHQLRMHMAWRGHPIVGEKVYGPDEMLYLQFIREGVTAGMLVTLLLVRYALHAARVSLRHPPASFEAPLPQDMQTFIEEHA